MFNYLHIRSTLQQTVWHRVIYRPLASQAYLLYFTSLQPHKITLNAFEVPISHMKATVPQP